MGSKKISNDEPIVRKTNNKIKDDGGDNKTTLENKLEPTVKAEVKSLLDRGDNGIKLQEHRKESPKNNAGKANEDAKLTQDAQKPLLQVKQKKNVKLKTNVEENPQKRPLEASVSSRILDYHERKRLRDRYTFRYKDPGKNTVCNEKTEMVEEVPPNNKVIKVNRSCQSPLVQDLHIQKEKLESAADNTCDSADKKEEQRKSILKLRLERLATESPAKKPIIKTIKSKNDTKVYKTVSFEENKEKTKQLEIKIPNEPLRKIKLCLHPQSRIPKRVTSTHRVLSNKFKLKPAPSRKSVAGERNVKVKAKEIKEKQKSKRLQRRKSDSSSVDWSNESQPATEVAKWAPASIDDLTQPYYEAWVNTTLAAISKISQRDKLDSQRFIKQIEKSLLERPPSPELFYENMADERYTGRIKITQGSERGKNKPPAADK